MKRAVIIVKGNVQMAGFRTFIKNMADSLNVKGFAENLSNGSVKIVCEGEKEKINALVNSIKENPPSFVSVEELEVMYEKYKGEFTSFERRGVDIPKEERGDAMLNYMQRFDKKGEVVIGILGSMNETLKSVKEDTSHVLRKQDQTAEKQDQMLGKQDQMLGKQDQMLGKQDETVNILKQSNQEMKEFREDTMQRFDTVDVKYGKIAENMEKAINAINRTCTNTERLLEKTERDRKDFRDAIDKMVNAIMSKK
jgi:acylphosphatase